MPIFNYSVWPNIELDILQNISAEIGFGRTLNWRQGLTSLLSPTGSFPGGEYVRHCCTWLMPQSSYFGTTNEAKTSTSSPVKFASLRTLKNIFRVRVGTVCHLKSRQSTRYLGICDVCCRQGLWTEAILSIRQWGSEVSGTVNKFCIDLYMDACLLSKHAPLKFDTFTISFWESGIL